MSCFKCLALALLVALATGCAAGSSSPHFNAGHTFRTPYGAPIGGAVHIGANQGGLILRPTINVKAARFPVK
jgi:hypothetical protein